MSEEINDFEENDIAEEQHRLFIEQATAGGTVWALRSAEGYATSPSNDYDEAEVIPFWSNPEAARALATDEWGEYEAVEISLSEFLETWLVGMQQEDLLVGTNWDDELAGTELEPLELAMVLTNKLVEAQKDVKLEHFKDLADFREQLRQALEEEGNEG